MRRYQPYYCEENVYWLVQEPALRAGSPHAVFITNRARRIRCMAQRASPPGRPTNWDYHVIAVAHGQAWDLDSRLGMPIPISAYLDGTFPDGDPTLRFRVVPAEELRATFTTDRSHMRGREGTLLQPPPPWDPPVAPGHSMNLPRFLDMDDPIAGRVLDLAALRAELAA